MAKHYVTEAGTAFRTDPGTRGRPITPERLQIIQDCMADGWPIQEVIRTHGIGYHTIMRYVPTYPKVTKEEQGELGQMARQFNALMRKLGLNR